MTPTQERAAADELYGLRRSVRQKKSADSAHAKTPYATWRISP